MPVGIFISVLNMSFVASYVILFVLLARLLLRKIPKAFSFALWIAVLFRLLCPFTFESSLGFLPSHANTMQLDRLSDQNSIVHTTGFPTNFAMLTTNSGDSGDPFQVWILIGSWVWLLGIVIFLIYSIIQVLQLKRKLLGATLLRDNIYRADHLSSAFVMGIIRPKIYLPSSLSEKEEGFIIAHEQYHIKRLDHITRILAYTALVIHWFNPLAWLAFLLSGKDMEMSCDESVLMKVEGDIRADYSSALLRLSSGRKIIAGTPLAFGEGSTISRIKNVMLYKKPAFWVAVIAATIVICLIVGLIVNSKDEPGGFAGVNAVVLEIDKENQTMTVAGVDENSVIGDQCVLTWEGNPFLTVTTNSQPKSLSLEDFLVGDSVVLFIGEVEETYPTRAKASTIQLQPRESGTDETGTDFLNNPEGVKFQAAAFRAAKAYLSGDLEELATYTSEDCTIDTVLDLYKDIDYMILKGDFNNIKSADDIRAAYEFKLNGEDSVSYVLMEWTKVGDDWILDAIGLEK